MTDFHPHGKPVIVDDEGMCAICGRCPECDRVAGVHSVSCTWLIEFAKSDKADPEWAEGFLTLVKAL